MLTYNLILEVFGGDGRQPVMHAQVPLLHQLQLRRTLGVRAAQQGAARGRVQHDHGCGAGDCDGVGALMSVRMLAFNCARVCVCVCMCVRKPAICLGAVCWSVECSWDRELRGNRGVNTLTLTHETRNFGISVSQRISS